MARNTPAPVQQFRGSAAALDNYKGPEGEVTYDRTNKTLRVQDGATTGGHMLVNATTEQTITGAKSFYVPPLVPTQAPNDGSLKAASTQYVDRAVSSIDPTTFPKASKTAYGVAMVGAGLRVENGVISLGEISTPVITSPTEGSAIDFDNLDNFTVVGSAFTPFPFGDTHASTRYVVEQDGEAVVDVTSATDLTSHTFTSGELTGLTLGQAVIKIQYVGATLGPSEWSAPVEVSVQRGQITPTGRTVYRHPNDKGSVIVYNEFGVTKSLFVFDAAYRMSKRWGQYNKVISGVNNWTHSYYLTCTNNVIDSDTGYVDLQSVADLTPYASQLTDAHFREALEETLKPLLQTAKAVTDILMTYDDTEAAHWCREKGDEVGLEGQLPNIYQLLVMFAEGDVVDSLDPTVAANRIYALGKYGPNTTRWFGASSAWSSTAFGGTSSCRMRGIGAIMNERRNVMLSTVPVAELD